MLYVFDEFQVELEMERFDVLKTSIMKKLVVKSRMELKDIYKCAHIELDVRTMEEKLIAMMDLGRQEVCITMYQFNDNFIDFKLHFDQVFIKLFNCRHGRPCKTSRLYGGTCVANQIGISIHKGRKFLKRWRNGCQHVKRKDGLKIITRFSCFKGKCIPFVS